MSRNNFDSDSPALLNQVPISDQNADSPFAGEKQRVLDSQNSDSELDSKQEQLDNEKSKPKWWENKSLEEKPIEGLYAWAVVASGFIMQMFCMGVVNSYGSYQTHYHIKQFPDEDMSTLSWIGTLQFAVANLFGILSGILCERFDSRLVTFVGGVIMGLALIIASFCDDAVWKLLITQGIMFGIGSSLVYIPSTSIPAQWFTARRALAVCIVVAGNGIGGLWLTPATDSMIENLGTGWALRITGIIILVVNSAASLFMRNRLKVARQEKIVDFSILRDIRFLALFAGGVCGTTGYFTPLFSLPSFAVLVSGKSMKFSTNLVTIMNAAITVGRLVAGQAAPYIGNINTMSLCTMIAGLSVLVLWLPFHATGTLIACAIVYGLSSGGFIGLISVVMADIWGVQRISTIVGLLFICSFAGTMIGAPSSGAILDNIGHGTDFKPSIVFSGVFMMCAFGFFTLLRFMVNPNPFKKA
ncbi:hypothetical protein LPJ56_000805 [Coemansia sp. RSA 2599]|nr:hypothetical protein LPJ75_000430 [Coemansia sp. RSA 2598]KAJ1828895.1 hypothetical protein LPJ56_000805 [Coemansia sp. RSA 2599]